jgi:lysozyme
MDSLKIGLKRWLNLVENHYGVKPIIYTGENYYNNHLKNDFYDYDFWIANYSKISSKLDSDWLFWQFTENGQVYGINHDVDINIFNGNRRQLKNVLID